ncbi:patatin-like phospholipase family protein [Crenobacter cavernae]|uniref:PNPLA domain-containing protein n=1 Tax=Crenobacter cavernae TaxID=2290923 RepID=A0A345Y8F4_9NEIS|nr:patatin-like phospholipase family protein [Crenobacter cavernae]AXK40206.1 hypothetical protein DWG20_12565 [Crenobacter cavernae]
MKRRHAAGWIALLLSLLTQAHAADEVGRAVAPAEPRIGLVLGGGGARGFAHLGVLKELERLRIPIACIAGTSAGALIGGMYASGVPLDDMAKAFREADWEQMLSGSPPRSSVPYDRKRDDYKNYFNLTLGVRDGGFRVPRSAINSQGIDVFIRRVVRDRSESDFDRLPIPFRAVATNLENGDAVVFDKGDLATVMRSSMAVPGLFDLMEVDGKLLVDGALARNLPIREAKGRCADRVIVVDVGSPTLKKDEINSLFDIVAQTSNLMVYRNEQEELKRLGPDDIVIRPDLDGYGSADFGKNAEIAARGRLAVAPVEARLAALSAPEPNYKLWHARLAPATPLPIDKVKVAKTSYVNSEELARALNDKEGKPQELDAVQEKLQTAFASGDYDRLSYSIDQENGRRVLTVMPLERAVGPNYLRFGVNLKSSTPGDSDFNFLAAHERVWLNSAGASWRNYLQVGDDKRFQTSLYQPLSAGSPLFVFGSYLWKEEMIPFFLLDHVRFADLQLSTSRFDVGGGAQLGQYGELRLGVYRQRQSVSVKTGDPAMFSGVTQAPVHSHGFAATLLIDQFDNPRWPRHGYFVSSALDFETERASGKQSQTFNGVADWAHTLGDTSLRLTGKYNSNLNGNRLETTPQMLGGFLNLSGYQQDELIGDSTALTRLMLYRRVATLPSALGSGLYIGGSLEAGRVWNWYNSAAPQDSRWITAGSLFLGADTLLGPFFVGFGNAKGGQLTGYLFLGVDY